jgi:hypothetical protein
MAAAGLALGLTIGGALAAGVWLGKTSGAAPAPNLAELKLHAMASHGSETFAIATGPVDTGVEGLFTLDFLTGDLSCYVINNRTGGVGGLFKTNVAKDLEVAKGKKPSYLIATGLFDMQGGNASNVRAAGCICYVVDANTGEVAAYTFPWSKQLLTTGTGQLSDMKLVAKWKARDLPLDQ